MLFLINHAIALNTQKIVRDDHIETSQLICSANQSTGFYMISQ